MVNTPYIYRVLPLDDNAVKVGTRMRMQFASPGDFVHVIYERCEGLSITGNGWNRVGSVADVWASNQSAWFMETATKTLYMKFVATGGTEYSSFSPEGTLAA